MQLLGGGAVLAGLMLGAIAAFIIDREFSKAAAYACAAAILSFFGFIHGVQLAWAASPHGGARLCAARGDLPGRGEARANRPPRAAPALGAGVAQGVRRTAPRSRAAGRARRPHPNCGRPPAPRRPRVAPKRGRRRRRSRRRRSYSRSRDLAVSGRFEVDAADAAGAGGERAACRRSAATNATRRPAGAAARRNSRRDSRRRPASRPRRGRPAAHIAPPGRVGVAGACRRRSAPRWRAPAMRAQPIARPSRRTRPRGRLPRRARRSARPGRGAARRDADARAARRADRSTARRRDAQDAAARGDLGAFRHTPPK